MSDDNLDATQKQIAILTHLQEVHKLLGTDKALSESVADKLELLPMGKDFRKLVIERREVRPYYNEKCALVLKTILDELIATKKPWAARLIENPGTKLNTLYQKVYQPWIWLMDNHPEAEKYKALRSITRIRQKVGQGVTILFRDDTSDVAIRGSITHEDADNIMSIQDEIAAFLEADITTDSVFEKKNLNLSDEQVETLKDSLAGAGLAATIVEPRRVKLLRKVAK